MDTNFTEGKVVNIDYLRQLSKGNTRFVEEMIKIFLAENPAEMKVLETAINQKDYDLIKATAHKLRSTLPYIGLDRVVEHEVNEMEDLAAAKKGIEEIETLFGRIKKTCQQACDELQAA
jgi:HPt (histidine-containing phosphotransfer) domain-containing protein